MIRMDRMDYSLYNREDTGDDYDSDSDDDYEEDDDYVMAYLQLNNLMLIMDKTR